MILCVCFLCLNNLKTKVVKTKDDPTTKAIEGLFLIDLELICN